MEKIVLIDKEVSNVFNVGIQYVLFQCLECGSKWGVSVSLFDNTIQPVSCVCRTCAQNKVLSEIK